MIDDDEAYDCDDDDEVVDAGADLDDDGGYDCDDDDDDEVGDADADADDDGGGSNDCGGTFCQLQLQFRGTAISISGVPLRISSCFDRKCP